MSIENIQASSADSGLYTEDNKRRKIEKQRVGDFIVKAQESIHFQMSNVPDQFFSPVYTHQLFGEKEQIQGYEGLCVDVVLSPKFLIPLIRISYSKKAPSFAPIDDIEAKFKDHYGKIYTDAQLYNVEVLEAEKKAEKFGKEIGQVSSGDKKYEVRKVRVDTDDFQEKQFYLQSVLSFFIDGASQIEANAFWQYFLLYDSETGHIAGFVTAYEAHKDADQFRTKISQVFVYPHYQRQGLGSKLYERIIEHYLVEPKCYEVIVEDANDEFQRVQDIVNSKLVLRYHPRLNALLKSKNGFLHTDADVTEAMSISVPELVKLSKTMKLSNQVVSRLIDLVVYSSMESSALNAKLHNTYRIQVKKRLYLRCLKVYPDMGKDKLPQLDPSKRMCPYIWNSSIEGDELLQESLKQLRAQQIKDPGTELMTQEGIKIQLKNMYQELVEDFDKLKNKVKAIKV